MIQTPVLIAGGGPVGLVLALELEHRGVSALLVEANPTTTRHPKMDVTNGRSMEHFRRLGIADEIRSHGVPSDHPMTVIWCTRLAEWELARFDYPSVDWGRDIIRYVNDGSLPLEPNLRISQVVLEPVLKNMLEERAKHIQLRFGWALDRFETNDDGINAVIRNSEDGSEETVRASYLAGCDGAGSVTRRTLGIELDDLLPFDPRGKHGRLYLIHFRSKDLDFFERFGRAWHIQSPIGGTLISQNDVDTWTLHVGLPPEMDEALIEPRSFLFECLGAEFDCEIIVANVWRPRLALAQSYGRGRVWMAGDSVHQVIPTGGYGMNTGVGDAVDLGWKLAAVLEGWGGAGLLASYESERRPIGERNRAASARHSSVRGQIGQAYDPIIHEESADGAGRRAAFGEKIKELGNLENEATGIELDYRYETSPIICHENSQVDTEAEAPAQEDARYIPSSWPGVRAPSLILANGEALFDRLGQGFTLLRFSDIDVSSLVKAAADVGLPLEVLDVRDPDAARLYERDLVLVRPDQHVAWRGNLAPQDPRRVIDRIRGAIAPPPDSSS